MQIEAPTQILEETVKLYQQFEADLLAAWEIAKKLLQNQGSDSAEESVSGALVARSLISSPNPDGISCRILTFLNKPQLQSFLERGELNGSSIELRWRNSAQGKPWQFLASINVEEVDGKPRVVKTRLGGKDFDGRKIVVGADLSKEIAAVNQMLAGFPGA